MQASCLHVRRKGGIGDARPGACRDPGSFCGRLNICKKDRG